MLMHSIADTEKQMTKVLLYSWELSFEWSR